MNCNKEYENILILSINVVKLEKCIDGRDINNTIR